MTRPLIGITGDLVAADDSRAGGARVQLNVNYAEAVHVAGGNPILLTPFTDIDQITPQLDGVLIPGGADIDAAHFGEVNHPKNELQHPMRFQLEERLYRALSPETPILGICYGCQFVNVMQGGTLEQHTPDRVGNEEHSSGVLQTYVVNPDSKLFGIVGSEEVRGKSFHHQAVGKVGQDLRVVANHADGTVEALEFTNGRWGVLLQWHPERTPNDPETERIFAAFVAAARVRKEERDAVLSR